MDFIFIVTIVTFITTRMIIIAVIWATILTVIAVAIAYASHKGILSAHKITSL
jgi:hypothetical protein